MANSVIPAQTGIQKKGRPIPSFRRRPESRRRDGQFRHSGAGRNPEEGVEEVDREKRIKEWKRAWKLRMIESGNPAWKDLYYSMVRLDSGLRRNDGQGLDSGLRRNDGQELGSGIRRNDGQELGSGLRRNDGQENEAFEQLKVRKFRMNQK